MSNIFRKLRDWDKEKWKMFREAVAKVKDERITLVFFGSRVKGNFSYLSDFDVLVIGETSFSFDFGDVFVLKTLEDVIREIKRFNTVVIDALVEGKPIIDNLSVFQKLRELALREIKKRGLKKTRVGWVPEKVLL